MSSIQRVLIIGPSNVGDAILIGDGVAAIRQQFPSTYLTLAVGERARKVFAGDPRIQTLVNLDSYSGLWGRLRLAAALWRYQPQIVVDFRGTVFPFLLKPLAFWRYLKQPPKKLRHRRSRHLWKLRAQVPQLSVSSENSLFPIWISPKDEAHVQQLRKRWGLAAGKRLIVICPGARSHIKRWTVDGFAAVADRLILEKNAVVIFCGEPEEKPIIEDVLSRMTQKALTAVGLTTLCQLAALMKAAQLVITNDSASLHAASAVNAPTIALFGPTDGDQYGPTAQHSRLIRRRLFCAPCEKALCRFSHECMRFISADEVYEAASQLIEVGSGKREAGKSG